MIYAYFSSPSVQGFIVALFPLSVLVFGGKLTDHVLYVVLCLYARGHLTHNTQYYIVRKGKLEER